MAIKLINPTLEYKDDVFAYKEEMKAANDELNGCGSLEKYDTFEDWIKHLNSYKDRATIDPKSGYVEGSQWLLVDDEKRRVLGMVNIRHYLNERLLRESGHIGYSVRPSERRKGFGKLQLALALKFLNHIGVAKALLVCDDDNPGSAKTIESCGGILENKMPAPNQSVLICRYWIDTNPSTNKYLETLNELGI